MGWLVRHTAPSGQRGGTPAPASRPGEDACPAHDGMHVCAQLCSPAPSGTATARGCPAGRCAIVGVQAGGHAAARRARLHGHTLHTGLHSRVGHDACTPVQRCRAFASQCCERAHASIVLVTGPCSAHVHRGKHAVCARAKVRRCSTRVLCGHFGRRMYECTRVYVPHWELADVAWKHLHPRRPRGPPLAPWGPGAYSPPPQPLGSPCPAGGSGGELGAWGGLARRRAQLQEVTAPLPHAPCSGEDVASPAFPMQPGVPKRAGGWPPPPGRARAGPEGRAGSHSGVGRAGGERGVSRGRAGADPAPAAAVLPLGAAGMSRLGTAPPGLSPGLSAKLPEPPGAVPVPRLCSPPAAPRAPAPARRCRLRARTAVPRPRRLRGVPGHRFSGGRGQGGSAGSRRGPRPRGWAGSGRGVRGSYLGPAG